MSDSLCRGVPPVAICHLTGVEHWTDERSVNLLLAVGTDPLFNAVVSPGVR
jgi:hypothetical protein